MIEFFFDSEEVNFEQLVLIEPVIKQIVKDYSFSINYINVVLMDDESLLEINREFLEHDYYTDIITFNYAESPKELEAELYISLDRVRENAESQKVSSFNELFRVIIHGVLHLVGFEDNTPELKNGMQNAENKYLNIIVSRETMNF